VKSQGVKTLRKAVAKKSCFTIVTDDDVDDQWDYISPAYIIFLIFYLFIIVTNVAVIVI
jgi:hypothetical protein